MKEISGDNFTAIDTGMSRPLSVINGLSCVFGSFGNMALIAVVLLHRQLHGASEILLMSLALADFVSCAIYLPLLIVRLNATEKLPTIMNQSRLAIGQAAVVCVSLNLLMLTIDRLIFFYRPLRYSHWMRKRIVTILIIIIYGISLAVGLYAYNDMIKSQIPIVVLVGIPMLAFFLLHYAIWRLAAAHRSRVADQEASLQCNYHVIPTVMVQARRHVATVMLCGLVYVVTWLPVTIFQVWRSIANYHDPESLQKYFYLLLTILQISSCLDPYLCSYRNSKVKAVFKKLLPFKNLGNTVSTIGNTVSMSCSNGLDGRKPSAIRTPAFTVAASLENTHEQSGINVDGNSNETERKHEESSSVNGSLEYMLEQTSQNTTATGMDENSNTFERNGHVLNEVKTLKVILRTKDLKQPENAISIASSELSKDNMSEKVEAREHNYRITLSFESTKDKSLQNEEISKESQKNFSILDGQIRKGMLENADQSEISDEVKDLTLNEAPSLPGSVEDC